MCVFQSSLRSAPLDTLVASPTYATHLEDTLLPVSQDGPIFSLILQLSSFQGATVEVISHFFLIIGATTDSQAVFPDERSSYSQLHEA